MKKIATFIAFGLCVSIASAQPPLSPLGRGTQAFRAIMKLQGLAPVDNLDEALAEPARTLIVLLGDVEALEDRLDENGLRRFVNAGGALLIATDRNTHNTAIHRFLEVWVDSMTVTYPHPGDPLLYQGREYCPFLQAPTREDIRSPIDILKGLKRVATDNSGSLRQYHENVRNKQRVVMELPAGSYFGRAPARLAAALPPMFAMAEELGRGKYLLMADHSVFINALLLQSDNDNHLFARNVLNWLTDDGRRDRVLFVEEGAIRTDFQVNLDYVDPPLPHPDVLGPLVDGLVEDLEKDDFFNANLFRPWKRQILRGVLLTVTALAGAFVLYRITAGRFRRDPRSVRLPERIEALVPPASQPHHDLNLAASELASQALHQALSCEPHRMPIVEASGLLARRSWLRTVRTFWELATGASPVTYTPAKLESLARSIGKFQQAIERGEIRLRRAEGDA